ncbi:MAG: hypothetical protein ABSE82_14715 [Nitrososphaerales archaeon]
MVPTRAYKELASKTRGLVPTLFQVMSTEKDALTEEEFVSKITTWLSVVDSDLSRNEH